MLSQADLNTIQTVFGKTAEELSGALSSETEVTLDLRLAGKVYTQSEIDAARTANQDAGIEIGFKKLATELDIPLSEGDKDAKIIAEKLKTTLSSSLEEKYKGQSPTDELVAATTKAVEWENKYNKLFETHEAINTELAGEKENYTKLQKDIVAKERNNTILSLFPEKMNMDRGDALLIHNNTFTEKEVDGVVHIYKGDQLMIDAVGKPETRENVIKSFVEEKKWIKGTGAGGGDRNPPAADGLPRGLSDEAAMKYMEEKGIESMSTKGGEVFAKITSKE